MGEGQVQSFFFLFVPSALQTAGFKKNPPPRMCLLTLERKGKGWRKGWGEREKEKHTLIGFLPYMLRRHDTHNLGVCPDWEANLQPLLSGTMLQPSHLARAFADFFFFKVGICPYSIKH